MTPGWYTGWYTTSWSNSTTIDPGPGYYSKFDYTPVPFDYASVPPPAEPTPDGPFDWLNRRVREITDLVAA
jgi:hypothetical protein